jgi:nucleotide-binding universal stress UspA family protein
VPDQKTVGYVTNIAQKLDAALVVLRVIADKETEAEGERNLHLFTENCHSANVRLEIVVKRGEVATAIIETAQASSADLIIMGVSHGEIVAEWLNAGAMGRTDIPVLIVPKWVSVAEKSPQGR